MGFQAGAETPKVLQFLKFCTELRFQGGAKNPKVLHPSPEVLQRPKVLQFPKVLQVAEL